MISSHPDIAVECLPINVFASKEPHLLPTPTVIKENTPMEMTVQRAEMPFAPIAIPPAKQFADKTKPSAIASLVEITRFLSSSNNSGFPAIR